MGILFLFTDCIVYGICNKNKLLSFGDVMQFDALFCVELVDYDLDIEKYKHKFCLKVFAKTNSLWLSFENRERRLQWMDAINAECAKFFATKQYATKYNFQLHR